MGLGEYDRKVITLERARQDGPRAVRKYINSREGRKYLMQLKKISSEVVETHLLSFY